MADKEFTGRGPGMLGGGNTEHNLTGFSSNAGALGDPDALWSHQPIHPGPKQNTPGKSFLDPAAGEPARQQLPLDIKEI